MIVRRKIQAIVHTHHNTQKDVLPSILFCFRFRLKPSLCMIHAFFWYMCMRSISFCFVENFQINKFKFIVKRYSSI